MPPSKIAAVAFRLVMDDHLALFTKGWDTMRRLFAFLTAWCLLVAALGCQHCGVCDCDDHIPCAGGCWGDMSAAPPLASAPIKTEMIKEPPKKGDLE